MEEQTEHWSSTFEHESITPDVKESFTKAMSKYDSKEAAIVGGFNAQKIAGKPFKLPESLDKLPDDNTRSEFRTQAEKLLGREYAKTVDDLNDIDYRLGMIDPEGQVDDNLINKVKEYAVKEGIDKKTLQKFIAFHNQATGQANIDYAEKMKADEAARAEAGNKALLAHYNGDAEKLSNDTELLRRVFQNQAGLNAEEYEQVAQELVDSKWHTHPVISKALMNLLPKLAAETTDEGSGDGKAPAPKKDPDANSPTYKALGWNK